MPPQENPASPLTFTASPLDRAALLRPNEKKISALLTNGKARIVPVWNQRHLISPESHALILSYDEAVNHIDHPATPLVFLGLANGEPWFALGFPGTDTPPDMGVPGKFAVLNDVVSLLPAGDATVLAHARAMVIWHFNHLHCGRCGAPSVITESGHSRTCTDAACGYRSFPRTDPAVIALVTNSDRCLLGRQAQWPAGMYSTIAGFVEPGETLEQTVRREVREETGIVLGDVEYLASQPWPFPSSIMLGFRAEALTTEIKRDDGELEDCRWFTRAELNSFGDRDTVSPGFKLPGQYSIARFLTEEWRREELVGLCPLPD